MPARQRNGGGNGQNTTSPHVHLGDPAGWSVGEWYIQVNDGGKIYYAVAPNQNWQQEPPTGDIYARYNGSSFTVTNSPTSSSTGTWPPGDITNPINDGGVIITKTGDVTEISPAPGYDQIQSYQDDTGKWHIAGIVSTNEGASGDSGGTGSAGSGSGDASGSGDTGGEGGGAGHEEEN